MTIWAMRTYRSLLAACLLFAAVVAVTRYADPPPSPKPFTKDDVVKLLAGNVPVKRVGQLVRERDIDFQITPQTESELRGAGADDALLATLNRECGRLSRPLTASLDDFSLQQLAVILSKAGFQLIQDTPGKLRPCFGLARRSGTSIPTCPNLSSLKKRG